MSNSVLIESPRRIRAEFKNLRVVAGDAELYEGPYEVTPKAYSGTTLPTKKKVLSEDVQVLPVPIYEVSNDAGGNTLCIAAEDCEVF